MSVYRKLNVVVLGLLLSFPVWAETQGTDDFRVHVETGVENTRFESERIDLTRGKASVPVSDPTHIFSSPEKQEQFKDLETGGLDNAVPEPVSTRKRLRSNSALIQSASTPVLVSPGEKSLGDAEKSGGGLFWAIVLGLGLVFIVLLLLLMGSNKNDEESKKKRRVEIRKK